MKCKFWLILAVLITAGFCGCDKNGSGSSKEEKNFDKDASYALGMNIAAGITGDGIIPDTDEFIRGIKDYLNGKKLRFDDEEAMEKIQTAYYAIVEKQEADYYAMLEEMSGEGKQEGIDFLNENSKKPGVITTASGLQYEVITEGNGPKPSAVDLVQAHYTGMFIDGMVFDGTQGGEPAIFPLNEVIPGWTEGLQLMSVGSKYRLYIPQELGYGPRGRGSIPPFTVLIFEVELVNILN